MISDSFDMESEAIITPSSFLGEKGKICDIAIATFSREIFPVVLKLFENEKIGEMKAANRIKPVYLLDVNNLKIAFYLSEIGASLSGTDIIEVNWMTGAKKFILFGSAGSLDKETTKGKLLFHTKHIEMRECLTIMHLRKIIYKLKMRMLSKIFLKH